MLIIETQLKESGIDGLGVFTTQVVSKHAIVYVFTPEFDRVYSESDVLRLGPPAQKYLFKYLWKSNLTGRYILDTDSAKFINHSSTPNLVRATCTFNREYVYVAKHKIEKGVEVTIDYTSFDSIEREDGLWPKLKKILGEIEPTFSEKL